MAVVGTVVLVRTIGPSILQLMIDIREQARYHHPYSINGCTRGLKEGNPAVALRHLLIFSRDLHP